ncbi:hypothetical protein SRHO_G00010910 [Serrasalmus rhombeus]
MTPLFQYVNGAAILERSSRLFEDLSKRTKQTLDVKMPQNCAAFQCMTRRSIQTREKGITFHKFPGDPVLKKKWELAVRRDAFIASPSTVLCSQHFTEDDFDRTGQTVRLRDGAVPSVFKFPAHLQKRPVTPRKTVTSQKAAAPVKVKTEPQPQSLPCEEHLYVVPCSLDKLKDKLSQAYKRIEDLERQLRNAKDRERRTPPGFHTIRSAGE